MIISEIIFHPISLFLVSIVLEVQAQVGNTGLPLISECLQKPHLHIVSPHYFTREVIHAISFVHQLQHYHNLHSLSYHYKPTTINDSYLKAT